MGKREKQKQKQKHQRSQRGKGSYSFRQEEDDDIDDTAPFPSSPSDDEEEEQKDHEEEEEDGDDDNNNGGQDDPPHDIPSKFLLYQQSVQSPKGDISYMQKFFLMYVGGRMPLHLQEDFCGTALLSTEWLRSDPRKTAVGLDLDLEALNWCVENNITKVGADGFSRISLFHGNVLQPLQSKFVKMDPQELIKNISLTEKSDNMQTDVLESNI